MGIDVQGYEDFVECSVGSVVNLMLQQIEEIFQVDFCYCDFFIDWKFNSYYCLLLQGVEFLMQVGEWVVVYLEK